MSDLTEMLRSHGLRLTSQRLAVARHVLESRRHPTADQVFEALQRDGVSLSRATVYNTLNTLVSKGLVQQRDLGGGSVVFDSRLEYHHHFVDEETGEVFDLPAELIVVHGVESLEGFDVREVQVVVKGRARSL